MSREAVRKHSKPFLGWQEIFGPFFRLIWGEGLARTRWLNPSMPVQPTPKSEQLRDPTKWVDRYGDALLRYAAARVPSHELAEDLVQDTFLAAFRYRAKFDGQCAFGTWLVSILRNKIADHYRKSGRTLEISDEAIIDTVKPFDVKGKWSKPPASWRATPDQLAENAEFWGVLDDCLGGLPAHLAQAFQMREIGLASFDEVSKLTGVTPKNLAVRLHRARLLLRACLERKWFCKESEGA